MKINNWIAPLNTEVFDFDLSIPITQTDFIEKINVLETTILKCGLKYDFFKVVPPSQVKKYGESQFLLKLQENKTKAYKNFGKSDLIFLFDTSLWIDEDIKISDLKHKSYVFTYSEDGKVISTLCNFLDDIINYNLGDTVTYEELQQDGVNEISIGFSSNSNIWFEEVDNEQIIAYCENQEENEGNRELALLNTPRLNSFFRDIKQMTEQLGGTWSLETKYPDKVTEDGILIEGKIICQEDMDESRIVPS